jgi:hypothetical protein
MERAGSRTIARSSAVLALSLILFLPACSDRGRTGREKAAPGYRAVIESAVKSIRSFEGDSSEILLHLKNTGTEPWKSGGQNPCFLSYHLLDGHGQAVKFDNMRTPLPRTVSPGDIVDVPVKIRVPLEKGEYYLEFDLLREGAAWFKDYGGKTLRLPLLAEERVFPEDAFPLDLSYGRYTIFRSSRPEFETLRKLIRITLIHDEVEWTGRTGKISGFWAGSGYPQVWLRDAATIIPASRLYYPEGFLVSWLREHLAFQKPDGSLEDWIDARGRSDKNTTESDQEASAVQSAYQVFLLKGPGWLRSEVAGETIIDRLEKSLLFLLSRRVSERYGLIRGSHTADWGDVDSEDADQKAIYAGENTHWTVDIYDQGMAYQACRELAAMFEALGSPIKAASWGEKAAGLKTRTNALLWQEDRGFYKVHVHLDSWRHNFDEDEMFAMGGNAQAILSGLAGPGQAARIIEQAVRRQQTYNVSTISGCLLPPYPAGAFKHPAVDEPYEYQNGGQWDWFGGRLIRAMFDSGRSAEARAKLLEVIEKDTKNGGLYEWDTRQGEGRGSGDYAGSAGSLARALFEGYFGLKLGEKSLSLEPKLGGDEAFIHAYFPAADIFVAYDYKTDAEGAKITFRYNSNFLYPGKIKMLVPRAWVDSPDEKTAKKNLEVSRDGEPIPYQWTRAGDDDFIVLDTDFRNHVLEIRPYLRPMQ